MASGINFKDLPDHIVDGMLSAQLDNQLIEYHKLMATLATTAGDMKQANEHASKLLDLIFMRTDTTPTVDEAIAKTLEEMENWDILIDKKSLPMPQNKLVRNPNYKPETKTQRKRQRNR